MPPDERVARLAGLAVVGQDLHVGLAAVLPGLAAEQVAELGAELQPALAHHARRHRQVVVRREVEVVGQRELEPARARRARGRHEEAALALVVEREVDPRRVEDRRAEEAHGRVARGADLPVGVEIELAGLEVPVLARRDAGRVAPVGDVVAVGTGEHDLRRVAARAGVADLELRLDEDAGLRRAVEHDLGADDPVVALAQHDVAGRADLVAHEVVEDLLGQHGFAACAQLDAAFRAHLLLADALEPVGAQEHDAALGFLLAADARPRRRRGRAAPAGPALRRGRAGNEHRALRRRRAGRRGPGRRRGGRDLARGLQHERRLGQRRRALRARRRGERRRERRGDGGRHGARHGPAGRVQGETEDAVC